MFVLLRMKGYRFNPRQDELLDVITGVAAGTLGYDDLVEFIWRNTKLK